MSWGDRWNAYWFRPAPLFDLAVLRLALTGVHLIVLVFPFALLTIPPVAMFDEVAVLPDDMYNPIPIVQILGAPFGADWRPTAADLHLVHRVAIAAAAFAFVGLFTRLALVTTVACTLFTVGHSYSFGEYHHMETIPLLSMLLLAASPSHRILSADAWIAGKLGRPPAPENHAMARWPILMVAWLFSLIYLSAAVCKLGGSGLDWLNGYTLQAYLMQDGLYWRTELGPFFAQQHAFAWLLGWFTIAWEGLFWVVLVRPRWGWAFAALGIGFHLGIYVTMRAPFAMYLPAYAALIPWTAWFRSRRAAVTNAA